MRDVAPPQTGSIEGLIQQFEIAQKEATERFEGLMRAAHSLHDQKNLFEEVIENSCDAIFVVEGDTGEIIHVNEAAEGLLGYQVEDLRGRRQITLFPEEIREDLKSRFRQMRDEDGISSLRTRMNRADGSQVDVSISANALPGANEGLAVGFARNITEQMKIEEDLRALNETLEKRVEQRTKEIRLANEQLEMSIREANRHAAEAEEATRAKSLFLANMTHEIRTPLTSVTGMLELLLDMDLGPKEKETTEIISRSARTLGGIIDNILDFSKIEAGKLEFEKVVFILPEIVNQVLETFVFQADEKGLKLELEMDDDLPEFVIGDPGRLRQVLVNLIGNALKFTQEGSVTLGVTKISLTGRRYSIKFSVRDTGQGIPESRQQDIFEAFTQADPTITRNFGGTGLGLNISHNLVAKMGGRLEVDSQEGAGSTFFFTAHLGKASERQIDENKNEESTNPHWAPLADIDTESLKILLVEDNKLNQRVALGLLSKLGCQAEAADDGVAALKLMGKQKYDLVFMDLQMPELGGLDTTKKIREGGGGEKNRNVPVIAMTAHATRDDRRDCLAAGMNDYVPKPISIRLVSEAMGRVLKAETKNPAPGAEVKKFSMGPLIAQTEGDEEIAAEVMDLFMADARQRLNLVIGALQNYDFDFTIQEAKSLKANALNVHSTAIVDLTREVILAAEDKQQEYALSTAEEIRMELDHMEAVI